MKFTSYSHRFAEAIIASDIDLSKRYNEFVNVLESITDDELVDDFCRKKAYHALRKTSFKSLTPSINAILKKK